MYTIKKDLIILCGITFYTKNNGFFILKNKPVVSDTHTDGTPITDTNTNNNPQPEPKKEENNVPPMGQGVVNNKFIDELKDITGSNYN